MDSCRSNPCLVVVAVQSHIQVTKELSRCLRDPLQPVDPKALA